MSRIDLSGERIDEIVLDEKGVPGVNKVDRDIVPDSKVTVQSKEPLEGTVHRVVEGNGIKTVEGSLSKEILVVVSGDVYRLAKTWGSLCWSSATSAGESRLSTCAVPG